LAERSPCVFPFEEPRERACHIDVTTDGASSYSVVMDFRVSTPGA